MGRKRRRKTASVKTHFQAQKQSTDSKPNGGWWFPRRSYANILVDHDSALTFSSVWACVAAITQPIAHMSCHVRQIVDNGASRILPTHPADWILSRQANPETSSFTFREILTAHALTWGNGYAEIERTNGGQLAAIWQITPDRVKPDRDSKGNIVYDVINRGAPNVVLPASKMLHLKGLGFDGIVGYSVIAYARQSIGLGLATEKFGAEFFGNGLHPGGVAEHPGKLSPQAVENLQKSLREQMKNAHDVLVLEEGMKWNKTTIPPEDAQFLETRQWQVPEICRWFRVPPHKIFDLSKATFSNIEHQAIEYVTDCLVPWCERWEQELDAKIFGTNRSNLYTKFNVAALLRGDLQTRYTAYHNARGDGWMSANDIRALEDMNPLPPHIGDTYWVPVNMVAMGLQPGDVKTPTPPQLPQAPDGGQSPEGKLIEQFMMFALEHLQKPSQPAEPPRLEVNLKDLVFNFPSPPGTEIHNNLQLTVPERSITVQGSTINLPSNPLSLTPIVNVAPPVVNVESPVVNITNNIEQAAQEPAVVNVNVEPAIVNIPETPVNVSVEPVINVEAPEAQPVNVTVEAPIVNVPETPVTVNVDPQINVAAPETQPVNLTVEAPVVNVPEPQVMVNVTLPTPEPAPEKPTDKVKKHEK